MPLLDVEDLRGTRTRLAHFLSGKDFAKNR